MNRVWTLWITNDDMEPLLVGIATTEKKAYDMKAKFYEVFEDDFEYQIDRVELDKINIDNTEIKF